MDWGGTAAVATATGISDRTIRRGILELDDPDAASSDRQRQLGAGRKCREAEQPKLKKSLDRLVASGTRGVQCVQNEISGGNKTEIRLKI